MIGCVPGPVPWRVLSRGRGGGETVDIYEFYNKIKIDFGHILACVLLSCVGAVRRR